MKQKKVERKKFFRRFYKDIGKRFLLFSLLGCLLVLLMPLFRLSILPYLIVFLISFSLSWITLFMKKERHRLFEEGDD